MIPPLPPEEPRSERRVHQALAGALDDRWTVLHSVGWQSERFGRPGDGEADFVLLSRRGVIVLEVKGGAVSLLDGTAADVAKELIRLTDQQIAVLQGLRRYRRMLIYGGAGTGKTVLAMAQARRLASEGFNVLLLCFNEPLGHKLNTEFANHES